MLVDALKDQWICSCGNWVDEAFEWCPDCCENKFTYLFIEAGGRKNRM
jgi:hypothetical protein